MATKCFVCNKNLGWLSPKAKTKDGKFVCLDDINNMYNLQGTSIPRPFKIRISNLTSDEFLSQYANDLKKRQKKEDEYKEQVKIWQTMDLSAVATKVEGINLNPREYGYYAYNDNINWYEERQRTKRIRFAGPVANVHIAKGLNYRLGSINTDVQHEQYLKLIFNGALLLTNKRIILGNNEGVKAYSLSRLLRAIPYSDGTVLCSESGKQVILTGFDDATEFNILLDRILTEDDILPK